MGDRDGKDGWFARRRLGAWWRRGRRRSRKLYLGPRGIVIETAGAVGHTGAAIRLNPLKPWVAQGAHLRQRRGHGQRRI